VDETLVANWLRNKLGQNYEVFFPINAQLEYVDLIVFNKSNQNTVTIQVKSSQSYREQSKDVKYWTTGHQFKVDRIKPKKVDFFIFTCYYPSTIKQNQKSRDFTEYFVVFSTDKLKKHIKKYKNPKLLKSGRVGFSFYIWPTDKKGDLYENAQLKKEYTKNDEENLESICEAKNNYLIIKQKLK